MEEKRQNAVEMAKKAKAQSKENAKKKGRKTLNSLAR